MATTIDTGFTADEARPLDKARSKARRSRIYLYLALACALVGVGGFMPTYWMQLPVRTFRGPVLLHIHGALCTAWLLFLISQSSLVTRGKVRNHRDWGLLGIALASVITVVGVTVAIFGLNQRIAQGLGPADASRSFLIVPLSAIGMFAGFTAAAIANVKRPEWHRRLMIVGTLGLVEAAAARIGFVLATGGGPGMRPGMFPPAPVSRATTVGLLLELLIVAGMIHDWRTMRRIHPAWIVGAAGMTAIILLRVPFSATPTWIAIADWLGRIAT